MRIDEFEFRDNDGNEIEPTKSQLVIYIKSLHKKIKEQEQQIIELTAKLTIKQHEPAFCKLADRDCEWLGKVKELEKQKELEQQKDIFEEIEKMQHEFDFELDDTILDAQKFYKKQIDGLTRWCNKQYEKQNQVAIDELEKFRENMLIGKCNCIFDNAKQKLVINSRDREIIDYINKRIKELKGGQK